MYIYIRRQPQLKAQRRGGATPTQPLIYIYIYAASRS